MEQIRNRLAQEKHLFPEQKVRGHSPAYSVISISSTEEEPPLKQTTSRAQVKGRRILDSDEDDPQSIKFPVPHPAPPPSAPAFPTPVISSTSAHKPPASLYQNGDFSRPSGSQAAYARPGQSVPVSSNRPPISVASTASTSKTGNDDSDGEDIDIRSVDREPDYDIGGTAEDANKALVELLSHSIGADLDVNEDDAIVEGFQEGLRLMPHQIQGRAWMKQRETGKKYGGILGDDMGLGKTIQTLTRILDGTPSKEHRKEGWAKATLIICPVGLIPQWAKEARSKCVGLKVVEHHGPNRTADPTVLSKADIVITSYTIVTKEFDTYQGASAKNKGTKKKGSLSESDSDSAEVDVKLPKKAGKKLCALFDVSWWRIVLDEAQNIKNRKAKSTIACFHLDSHYRWCLTGTPIQNNVEELWPLLHFLKIKPLSDWDHFNNTIAKPVKKGKSQRPMKRLQIVLNACMLRRTKDQQIDGKKILNLPKRNVEVVVCEFDDDERAFYLALEERTSITLNKFVKAGEVMKNYTSVLLLLLRLRQACNHPALVSKDFQKDAEAVESKPAAKDDDDDADDLADLFNKMSVAKAKRCAICQEELSISAEGIHCDDCEVQVAATSRRKSITHATKKSNDIMLPPDSTKIRKIIELLEIIDERSNRSDKTIVFSQFTSMLDLVEPFLKDQGIKFVRYDGKMHPKHREEALETIRNSRSTRVILISFKAGSTGLNLTACNNVILADLWWNPALEDQAFDRAHRLGQQKDVFIYKLTVDNTVEERILKLQESKRELAKAALSGDRLKINKLGLDDLMRLFKAGYDEEE